MIHCSHSYKIWFMDDFGNMISEISDLSDAEWDSRFYFLDSDHFID